MSSSENSRQPIPPQVRNHLLSRREIMLFHVAGVGSHPSALEEARADISFILKMYAQPEIEDDEWDNLINTVKTHRLEVVSVLTSAKLQAGLKRKEEKDAENADSGAES